MGSTQPQFRRRFRLALACARMACGCAVLAPACAAAAQSIGPRADDAIVAAPPGTVPAPARETVPPPAPPRARAASDRESLRLGAPDGESPAQDRAAASARERNPNDDAGNSRERDAMPRAGARVWRETARTGAALAGVLALVLGCAAVLRRALRLRAGDLGRAPVSARGKRHASSPAGIVEIIGRYPFGRSLSVFGEVGLAPFGWVGNNRASGGESLLLLRVEGKVVLVWHSPATRRRAGAITPVCEIDDAHQVGSILAKAAEHDGRSMSAHFARAVERFERRDAGRSGSGPARIPRGKAAGVPVAGAWVAGEGARAGHAAAQRVLAQARAAQRGTHAGAQRTPTDDGTGVSVRLATGPAGRESPGEALRRRLAMLRADSGVTPGVPRSASTVAAGAPRGGIGAGTRIGQPARPVARGGEGGRV